MEAVDLSRLSTVVLRARYMPALTSPPPPSPPSTLHTDQAEETQHDPGLQLMALVTVPTWTQEITDVTQFGEPRRGDMSGDIWDTCDPLQFDFQGNLVIFILKTELCNDMKCRVHICGYFLFSN